MLCSGSFVVLWKKENAISNSHRRRSRSAFPKSSSGTSLWFSHEAEAAMSTIDLLTRVSMLCKKYEKYDTEKLRLSSEGVASHDHFLKLYTALEQDLADALEVRYASIYSQKRRSRCHNSFGNFVFEKKNVKCRHGRKGVVCNFCLKN